MPPRSARGRGSRSGVSTTRQAQRCHGCSSPEFHTRELPPVRVRLEVRTCACTKYTSPWRPPACRETVGSRHTRMCRCCRAGSWRKRFPACKACSSKSGSWAQPYANVRVGLQYTWCTRFSGLVTNVDGAERRASDDDTLYLYMWLSFWAGCLASLRAWGSGGPPRPNCAGLRTGSFQPDAHLPCGFAPVDSSWA